MAAQQPVSDLARKVGALLGQQLVAPICNPKRAPTGLDAALERCCSKRFRNVWLDAGFQAWYAWFSVDIATQTAMAQLPGSELREIASSLCSIRPHHTIQTLFEHLFYKSYRHPTRRRLLKQHSYSCPEPRSKDQSLPAPPASFGPSQMALTGIMMPTCRQPPLVNSNNNSNSNSNSNSNDDDDSGDEKFHINSNNNHDYQFVHFRQPGDQPNNLNNQPVNNLNHPPSNFGQPPEVRSCPEPRYLTSILPYHTSASVVKTGRGASIRIVSSVSTAQGHLELDIYSAQVPYIARELFGAIIQAEHGRLYLKLDSGANASFESIRLSGAEHQAAQKVLGQLYSAVCNDAHFVQESERGEAMTSYITLEVNGDVKDNSHLCVIGNASSMLQIAGQLWPGDI